MSHSITSFVAAVILATCLSSCAPVTRLAKSALSMPMRLLKGVKGGISSTDMPATSGSAVASRAATVQNQGDFTGSAKPLTTSDSAAATASR